MVDSRPQAHWCASHPHLQLDKLSVRSRVVGRDIKLPIQQLQAAAGQQAEALVGVAARMERLEKDIRDTGAWVNACRSRACCCCLWLAACLLATGSLELTRA
jgi:hypothetical protein